MKTNNKIRIILLVFALASLFLVIFFIWPLLKEIDKNSRDLISAGKNIVILAAQSGETENFKNNYESYKPNLEKIDSLFIDPADPVNFIKFLEDTAAGDQVTLQISSPPSSQNSAKKGPNFIMFQFSSKGSFSQMSDFSRKIEMGPYVIEIENLTIQNAEGFPVSASPEDKNISKNIAQKDYSSRNVNATFAIGVFTVPH
jgi:hypothetical protein